MNKRDFEFYLQKIMQETAYTRNINPSELEGFLDDRKDLLDRVGYTSVHAAVQDLLNDVRSACQRYGDMILDQKEI